MTRPLRICVPFVGDSVGGSHMSMLLAIENLDQDRYDPMLVLHEDGPLAAHLRDRRIPYRRLPLPGYAGTVPSVPRIAGAALRATPRLRAFLREEAVDLVHGNDLRMNLTWPLACRWAGRPFLWHQRTLLSRSRLWRAIPLLATRVLCISQAVAETLPHAARPRADILYNPFRLTAGLPNREQATADLRREHGLPNDARIVAYVGRLVDQKRPETVLRGTAAMAARVDAPLHLLFIGLGAETRIAALKQLASELGFADRVHFPGFVYPVESALAGCNLLVAAAVGDGFGRSLVEAMLLGVPVIASDSGGHQDIVADERTGLLFPPDDIPALAEAGIRLLTDPTLRAEIAGRARHAAADRFSVAAHVAGLSKTYAALVAGRPKERSTK